MRILKISLIILLLIPNLLFADDKFERNIERDKVVNESYDSIAWEVTRIWECEINEERLHNLVNHI